MDTEHLCRLVLSGNVYAPICGHCIPGEGLGFIQIQTVAKDIFSISSEKLNWATRTH